MTANLLMISPSRKRTDNRMRRTRLGFNLWLENQQPEAGIGPVGHYKQPAENTMPGGLHG